MAITEIIDAKMPSLTEWLEKIGYGQAAEFRAEDNSKRDRLEILFQEIGLPYDRSERMTARDIVNNTPLFQSIVAKKGNLKCALRLVPTKSDLPKLRQRGQTLNEYLNGWFKTLNIDPDDYKVEVVPHNEITLFSTIFIVDNNGAWGDIIAGSHWHLSQGIYETTPLAFSFDFKNWHWSNTDKEAQACMEQALSMIKVADASKQKVLQDKLGAEFNSAGHLKGYFEFIVWPETGISYIDYNRLLYKILGGKMPAIEMIGADKLSGVCACPGVAQGKVRIVFDPKNTDFSTGEILVCPMTMVDYVPLMQKAVGIITEQGNILSHAAIVSRELDKPCLVGVKNATTLLKNGNLIELDADKGSIKML